MFKDFIETFRKPSATQLAQRELEDAQRQLLAAQSGFDYAKNMVRYHQDRVARLKALLTEEADSIVADWPATRGGEE